MSPKPDARTSARTNTPIKKKLKGFSDEERAAMKARAIFGFSDKASLDEGSMWPTAFALKELTPETEARISALLRKALRHS
jgi:hypothetical protein